MQRCQTDQRRCHWKRYIGEGRAAEQLCDEQASRPPELGELSTLCDELVSPFSCYQSIHCKNLYLYFQILILRSEINRKALNHFKEGTFESTRRCDELPTCLCSSDFQVILFFLWLLLDCVLLLRLFTAPQRNFSCLCPRFHFLFPFSTPHCGNTNRTKNSRAKINPLQLLLFPIAAKWGRFSCSASKSMCSGGNVKSDWWHPIYPNRRHACHRTRLTSTHKHTQHTRSPYGLYPSLSLSLSRVGEHKSPADSFVKRLYCLVCMLLQFYIVHRS